MLSENQHKWTRKRPIFITSNFKRRKKEIDIVSLEEDLRIIGPGFSLWAVFGLLPSLAGRWLRPSPRFEEDLRAMGPGCSLRLLVAPGRPLAPAFPAIGALGEGFEGHRVGLQLVGRVESRSALESAQFRAEVQSERPYGPLRKPTPKIKKDLSKKFQKGKTKKKKKNKKSKSSNGGGNKTTTQVDNTTFDIEWWEIFLNKNSPELGIQALLPGVEEDIRVQPQICVSSRVCAAAPAPFSHIPSPTSKDEGKEFRHQTGTTWAKATFLDRLWDVDDVIQRTTTLGLSPVTTRLCVEGYRRCSNDNLTRTTANQSCEILVEILQALNDSSHGIKDWDKSLVSPCFTWSHIVLFILHAATMPAPCLLFLSTPLRPPAPRHVHLPRRETLNRCTEKSSFFICHAATSLASRRFNPFTP
ncbi:BRI1-associated receptor kinase [Striga asiatica]|uniref:BRI1-associated receptor kinase n=1 Tax=Striga asiatica TaxID=4170 RepID=A0A5A7QEN6_STRAF|nr:BRI1-associated receptor kinase [Striga asiatica]